MPVPDPLRVLLVEDRPSDARLMLDELRAAGFNVAADRVETEADYLARLDPPPDVILCDYSLPQFGAPRALELVRASGRDVPLVIVSSPIDPDTITSGTSRPDARTSSSARGAPNCGSE